MLETIDGYAPSDPTSRFAVAVLAAVVGVLAVGDALNVVLFPAYQLGLPDTTVANAVVFLLGVALLAVTYRLVAPSVGDAPGASDEPAATDGAGAYDDRDPEEILAARYARGELTDDEFERMRSRLDGYDDAGSDYDDARDFAENHDLHDRQTVVD